MRTVIIKVTHNCNLGCKYCCVGDVLDHSPMSFDTIRNLFKKLSEEDCSSSLIWHGGEPLSVGLNYFKEIVKLQAEFPEHHFRNGIQTNGTLLTDEYLQFFKDNHFQLGFSIDGCPKSHNLNRPYKTNKASFDDTFKWFLRAKEFGLHVGAICVINVNTAKYIDEIYRFAKEQDIPFKFNPQYPAGRASINFDLGLDNDQIAKAYIRLFDLWYNDDSAHRANIRMFDSFVSAISRCSNGDMSLKGYDCAYCNRCQYSFVGVAPNGDIYPCGKFVGEEDFCCGNINQDEFSFRKLLEHTVVKSIIKRHEEGVEDCKKCQYWSLCSSGCPYNAKLFAGDIMSKNPFCRANLLLFDHIKNKLIQNNVAKDIFIIPTGHIDEQYIIYSPLRGKAFLADKESQKDVQKYIETGAVSTKNKDLYKYLQEWNSQIAISAKDTSSSINTDSATILLTHKCNMACGYCYSKDNRSQQSIDKSKLKSVINHILKHNKHTIKSFSFIGGGEPTIEWDLFQWSVNYINTNKYTNKSKISLTTNGTLLNKERILWLKDNKIHVIISFDVLPTIQNIQRPLLNNTESFSCVNQAIIELLNKKVPMRIRTTITKDSASYMPEMVRYIHQNYPGIKDLQLEPVLDENQNDKAFFDDFKKYFLETKQLGLSLGVNVYNTLSLSLKTLQTTFCQGEMCVFPTGDISICHRISEKDSSWNDYCFGKIDGNSVVIEEEKLRHALSYHCQKDNNCSTCFAQYHCAGGCSAFRSKLTPEQFKIYCDYSKDMLKELILFTINNL